MLGIFENSGINENKNYISLKTLKGFVTFLYEVYMIYIPYDQVENMVDYYACSGNMTYIVNAQLKHQKTFATVDITNHFNKYANLLLRKYSFKDIIFGSDT